MVERKEEPKMELKEKQKQEAIKRMKHLQIMDNVIKDFKNKGIIYYSERINSMFPATLYWLTNNPEWVKMVKEFEEINGALVYHAQLTHTKMGDLLSLMYVSKNEEDWKEDHELLINEDGMMYSMVYNLDDDMLSDMGIVQMKPAMGGVVRIA